MSSRYEESGDRSRKRLLKLLPCSLVQFVINSQKIIPETIRYRQLISQIIFVIMSSHAPFVRANAFNFRRIRKWKSDVFAKIFRSIPASKQMHACFIRYYPLRRWWNLHYALIAHRGRSMDWAVGVGIDCMSLWRWRVRMSLVHATLRTIWRCRSINRHDTLRHT